MEWRKSSFSGVGSTENDCVEVRRDLAAVRDSKSLDGPALVVDLSDLLAGVKTGQFDR
nr:DUF397 domain-containing protein [Kibdelosporangium sp. MJ126-NF4]CEL22101.1 hypothetical protein [Kibdelosporangium sp. MJ126-NF4]CTQ92882.1 hypothetical protein [Kibdelosporangium sp. MJ126-NF4]